MARALLLHNPAARNTPDPGMTAAIARELAQAGWAVERAASGGPGDIARLAGGAGGEGFELVVACGGDGTVRETAEGLFGGEVPMAIVPLGTANVLAREIGLPVGRPLACAAIAARDPHRAIGAGTVNGGPVFTFSASAGLDSLAVATVDLKMKRQTGAWAYVHAALMALLSRDIPPLEVEEAGGRRFEACQVFAARARRYGGGPLFLSREARLESPTMRLIALGPPLASRLPLVMGGMLRGGIDGLPGVFCVETEAFRVSAPTPFPVQADGDAIAGLPAEFRSRGAALRLVFPG